MAAPAENLGEHRPLVLLYGASGWIGGQMREALAQRGCSVVSGRARLEDRSAVLREVEESGAEQVVNCAGRTGRPNVDWCEEHREETLRANVVGALNVCSAAWERGLHVTQLSTGCLYEYDAAHPAGSGRGFREDDPPNFTGSFYSRSKAAAEALISDAYPDTVLQLRLRMPLSDDMHPRGLLAKITSYARVADAVPNSVSVLHDLLPVAADMALTRCTGVFNFANPGAVTHADILRLYRELVDPAFVWQSCSEADLRTTVRAPRSNNELDVSKLLALYPRIPHIRDSLPALFRRLRTNLSLAPV